MTVSSMDTGCDVSESDGTGSDVTGIDVIRPKVGHYPWGVILIVRGVVWYSNDNRVHLHYSVSIAAAAATTAHIHLSAEAAVVYIPLSAAEARYSPRSAFI
jgi:hypothetical protein